MDINVIELLNGEKLIAGIVDTDTQEVTLDKAFVIAPQPQSNPNEEIKFALVPWPIFREPGAKEVTVNRNVVVTQYVPGSQLVDHYNRATSSLILPPRAVVPPVSKLITE